MSLFFVMSCVLALAMLLSIVAALRGPSLVDRMVAFDVFGVAMMCAYVVWCVSLNQTANVVVFCAWAATSFVAHVAVARLRDKL